MIRAVVDTNVLVSGLISASGYPREIERRWRKGEFALVTSPEIIEEVSRVLHSPRIQPKYQLADSDIQAFVLALLYHGECVAGRVVLEGVAPDPGDDKIVACAVEGKAGFIVTGDKGLRRLGEYDGIATINAEEFMKVLDRSST
jgi:putative PIN family toxin of toxin-antitoxin system